TTGGVTKMSGKNLAPDRAAVESWQNGVKHLGGGTLEAESMAKNSRRVPLTVVGSTPASLEHQPPAPLGKAGADLWTRIISTYDIPDEGGRQLLFEAAMLPTVPANSRRQSTPTVAR